MPSWLEQEQPRLSFWQREGDHSHYNNHLPAAMVRTIETQRQAKTPLQLLCLPNAPFVETIAFRALTGRRSAARERWLEDPKRQCDRLLRKLRRH